MSASPLAGFPVVIEQVVAWADMDAFRHVNNIVYFRYFENSRITYFQRLDWFGLMERTGIGPIVASTQARFRRAVAFPETLHVGSRLLSMGEDRFTLEHHIFSPKQGELVTLGECVVVSYDYRERQKTALPPELRRAIEQLEGLPSAT